MHRHDIVSLSFFMKEYLALHACIHTYTPAHVQTHVHTSLYLMQSRVTVTERKCEFSFIEANHYLYRLFYVHGFHS